jgi:hypothetical protein
VPVLLENTTLGALTYPAPPDVTVIDSTFPSFETVAVASADCAGHTDPAAAAATSPAKSTVKSEVVSHDLLKHIAPGFHAWPATLLLLLLLLLLDAVEVDG